MEFIRIRGARTHNLQNINLDLPRDQFIVITGLSGSGKSSLAFDTIYAEGQRRYVESLSTYARQFLSLMEKPDIDLIEGLSPAISIEQKASSHNPRSTVGTVTEIYDYLRLLYARIGSPRCPNHNIDLEAQTVSQMVDITLALPTGTKVLLLAPVIRNRKGSHEKLLDDLRHQGFIRARIDQRVTELDDVPVLKKNLKHDIDVVIDRLVIREGIAQRLAESFEMALTLADDMAIISVIDTPAGSPEDILFSAHYACPHCGFNYGELEPRSFSFNNPAGACKTCDGLGIHQIFSPDQVISDRNLSLAEGAIPGWDRRNPFVFSMLNALSQHYDFDITTPFSELSEKLQQIILYGSGREKIDIEYPGHRRRRHAFEGVIPNLERRYRETESNSIREDIARFISNQPCSDCAGSRLSQAARHVFINDLAIHQVTALPIIKTLQFFEQLNLAGKRAAIAERIVREITQRLRFLADVGLQYLTLDRSADTLSGGESQRIRLASQIGSGLVGVMYVLDEPSIGLHQRDNKRLLNTLFRLRDLGNTVIVVEHDEEAIISADYIVDIGPGAGLHGGQIVAQGQLKEITGNPRSLTGQYLSGSEQIPIPHLRSQAAPERMLLINGASGHNLQQINVAFPVGLFICVTGVSGSGKSTLVNHTLYPAIARQLNNSRLEVAPFTSIQGINFFDKIIDINQRPIGRTPRSNPATYTGLFTPIRELFAGTPEARIRGYKPGRFSFNVRGGR
ncbi:MAG TPA: excinuclease ABC subunit A, partial [Gammaproteobacteria bacterium]|nr:excinuclease ABC subunit A [Gammaproteobacteria bacterium]